MNDLEIAFAMERLILNDDTVRLACNCILKALCTMPVTLWTRVFKYEHRCPRHSRGSAHLFNEWPGPVWLDSDGAYISLEVFKLTFNTLAAEGVLTLVPGYNQGRTKLPSVLSMEGTHWIIDSGKTEMLRRG